MHPEMWVVVYYWPHEPTEVHGPFGSEPSAYEYAHKQGLENAPGAFEVKLLRIENHV